MKTIRDYNGYQHLEIRNKLLCKIKNIEQWIMTKTTLEDLNRILVICGNCSKFKFKEISITRYEEQSLREL